MTGATGTPPAVAKKPSHRDLAPLEQGGRTAREGFAYQDHVTVSKCLDMLLPEGPSEVWCEAEDDIVLVWSTSCGDEFEFVQVKGHDLKQAWTVAKLCSADAGKDAKKKSIVEKSLDHDRGAEGCRFRIITTWAPDEVLNVLCVPVAARSAPEVCARLTAATAAIEKQLGGPRVSPNGNSLSFWVEYAEWEHRATTVDVKNGNLVKLDQVLEHARESLAPDQRAELYAALFAKIQDAALADAIAYKAAKRLVRKELYDWLKARAYAIQNPNNSGGTGRLVAKLSEAGVDDAGIEAAKELRRRFVAEARVPKYLTVDDRDAIEGDILAALHALKVRLDAGEYGDTGKEFLARCQDELRRIRDGMDAPRPSERLFYGCMYEVMNRCLHRLSRVTP
ncbi:MAG: dsDNA nuclease domain-containing protein [Polyangiaceae bacterium]